MRGKRFIRLLRWSGASLILAAIALLTRGEIGMAGNEASRFAVVQAVGEQGVFSIEKTNFRTVDKVFRDGHFYSDKPPALAWSLGMLWKIPHRLFGFSFEEDYRWSVWMVNFFLGSTASLLIYLWLFNALRRETRGPLLLQWLLALAAPLNGWLLAYSTVLNNHTPAAAAALGMTVALMKFRRRPTAAAAALAGTAAGIVGAMELPPGAFFGAAAVAGVWFAAPRELRLRRAAVCAAAGLCIVAGLTLLNFYAYGTPVPLYLAGKNGGTYAFPTSIEWEVVPYAVDTLMWTRGLFSYQPFLLLALPGIWLMRRSLRAPEWAALAASAATGVFYLLATNEYGGAAYGFRYFIVFIPVLWFFASRLLLALWRRGSRSGRRAAVFCSVFLILWGTVTGIVGSYAPFCVAFEGPRSPRRHFTRAIQSTFCGNLLCIAYDFAPYSPVTRAMIRHYGRENSYRYLHHSFFSLKRLDLLQRINDDLK